jgi:hypothetical protein
MIEERHAVGLHPDTEPFYSDWMRTQRTRNAPQLEGALHVSALPCDVGSRSILANQLLIVYYLR